MWVGEIKAYVGNVLWVTSKGSEKGDQETKKPYTFITLFSVICEIAEGVCTTTANCP